MRTTPALLIRTAAYLLLGQALAVLVIAAAVPRGAAWMTVSGFVTPWYDSNVLAVKLLSVPWTDPTVFVSVQTMTQMIAIAAAGSALITLARTNPWERGALPDSAASSIPKEKKPARAGAPPATGSAPAAAAPAPAPAAPALPPAPAPGTAT